MNQRPFFTLFLWAAWGGAAITLYILFFSGTEAWSFVREDPSRITWLILMLFMIGLFGSFVLVVLITIEAIAAWRIDRRLAGKGLAGIGKGEFRLSVGKFFDALKGVVEASGHVDVEALLTTKLAMYQRTSHSIEVFGNMLITLGLIGTVMGLTLTLTGLTGSLDALGHDQEMMMSGLRRAMAGMGTAFYTTLLGAVLGGVLLRMFAQITDHGIHNLFDTVMHSCLVHCSVDLKPSLQRDIHFLDNEIQALGAHLQGLESAFQRSREAMTAFRQEVSELRARTEQEREQISDSIRRHQAYSRILREEARLMNGTGGSWWRRWWSRRHGSESG
jgi:hypothetical protein